VGLGRIGLLQPGFFRSLLEGLPTDFNRGAPRVIEAAAIAGLARNQTGAEQKAELLERARKNLSGGITQDPTYWHGILSGRKRDMREGYTIPISLLEGIYENKASK
jgi:hypothetical protein